LDNELFKSTVLRKTLMTTSRLSRLDALDDLLFYRLSRVAATAGSMVIRLCEGQYGITRREWRLLGRLVMHDKLTPTALADKAQLDKAQTSKAITSLVKKNLVERHAKTSDRRYAELCLTDAGRALYVELMPQVRQLNLQLLDVLQADEVELLDGLLDRLQSRAQTLVAQHHDELPKTMRYKGGKAREAGYASEFSKVPS
jgi:DNA-binding MarR family transcriptional regulator